MELAPGYLKGAYDIIRNAGGICIADEVQSGFGRTGSHYWGFETQGVIPDIVTMAKVCLSLSLCILLISFFLRVLFDAITYMSLCFANLTLIRIILVPCYDDL